MKLNQTKCSAWAVRLESVTFLYHLTSVLRCALWGSPPAEKFTVMCEANLPDGVMQNPPFRCWVRGENLRCELYLDTIQYNWTLHSSHFT